MTTPDAAPAPPPSRRLPKLRTVLILALVIPVVLLSIYTWLALHWDYSNGYRSGLLQKFSQKGWLCKTDEGELWQSVVTNVAPNVWYFTVRDPNIKQALDTLVGKNVRLHYTEHRGVPTSCFGDTNYYVDGVTVITP
ncbi:MAG TPA: hypothetical protein VLD58_09995 [Gemmatimonadales bacterium]|nr:hypothetical protein [Gemmatimonadales bacterium]